MKAPIPAPLARSLLVTCATVALAFGLATAVRHGLIERDDLGPACDVADPAWWCAVRIAFIRAFVHGIYGYASLALAASAAWWRRSWPACAALVVGTFGMVLYDFTWSGAGVVVAVLVLAHLRGQWQPHGEAEQHAH